MRAEHGQQLYVPRFRLTVRCVCTKKKIRNRMTEESHWSVMHWAPKSLPPRWTNCLFREYGLFRWPVWPLSSPPSHNICIFTHSLLPESQQKRLYLCTIFSHAYDWKVLSMGLQCAFQSSEFKKKIGGNRKTLSKNSRFEGAGSPYWM